NQRRRWASKSTKYRDKRVVLLGVSIWLFNLSLIAGLVQFIANLPNINVLFLAALAMKFLAEVFFIYPLCHLLNRRALLVNLLPLFILLAFYLVYFGLDVNVGKSVWKW